MARLFRLAALSAAAMAFSALLQSASPLAAATTAGRIEAAQLQFAEYVAAVFLSVLQTITALLPGLLLAASIWAMYSLRERLSLRARCGFVALLFACLLALTVTRGKHLNESAEPERVATPVRLDNAGAGAAPQPAGPVHSGEEVLMNDGSFRRLADPNKMDGPVEEGWQQALAKGMVNAIASGEEQVVIMFTRQGCPWCEKQLPVLQDAIRRRSAAGGNAAGAAGAGLAFVGGVKGGNLLQSPLRIFVLDANEFPQLIQQFQIQAFPTSIIFGAPRVAPLMGKGFLDEDTLDQMLMAAATAQPEPEEQPRGRRRRGFFR
mmetsp:Transcript_5601/g.10538  ORF Transcript_5601/g.10538 Transcript_5601/m.10538 type:complete len:320 (+) Transcript_5601:90-1049(+)